MNRPFEAILIRILMGAISFVNAYALGKEGLSSSTDSERAASRSYREIGRMNVALPPVTGATGAGIAVENTHVKLAPPAKHWKGHWDAGQSRLPSNGRIVLRAEVKGGRSAFSLQAYGGKIMPKPDSETFENNLYEAVWLLNNSGTQILSALWLTLNRVQDEASAKILELSVWQTAVKNRLDADTILETPPVHRAELKLHNGAMTIFLDDEPITGQMWSSLCYHNVKDEYLRNVLNGSGYPIAAIPFAVGENNLTNLYPSTWLGLDEYDWSYIDTHAHRVLKARPDTKLVLQLAVDGAKWWNKTNPEAANLEVDAIYAKSRKPGPKGVPDYLSPLWRSQMRELLRQLVAHVQSSDWGAAVIGYELFNGSSMDCNFLVPHSNPRVIRDFRRVLKEKYRNDAALQHAWDDPKVTLDSALLWTEASPPGLILEPAKHRWFFDTKELIGNQFRSVFSDVAAILKEATHRRALVGARTGDFFGNYGWNARWFKMEDSGWLPPLLSDPNIDFLDVQEPYPGRQLGGGAGVPVLPPHALQHHGKTVFIQNDVRTHLSKPNAGYGRTPDLESTIQLQRRVFANALTYNMVPYLFQLAFSYDQPELLAEYRQQEMILREAIALDRSSVAENAIVFDPEMRLYLGTDTKQNEPSRYFALFDFTKHVWQRGGAPFDMIFLDQIEKLPPYRVYVFCHTWRYTPEQMRMIRRKVLTNGQCAVFLWADGVISDDGSFSAAAVGELTGMDVQMSPEPASWHMIAAQGVPGIAAGTEVGTLPAANYDACAPGAPNWKFEPSFWIEPKRGIVPLAHRADGSISAAMRREADHTVIYSASGNSTAPIFKLALESAGAFRYTDSSALLMMNRSYLAFHADQDETIELQLPTAQQLVNLFTGEVHPKKTVFEIPVRRSHTYVFARQ